jgi:hypothetical protein
MLTLTYNLVRDLLVITFASPIGWEGVRFNKHYKTNDRESAENPINRVCANKTKG